MSSALPIWDSCKPQLKQYEEKYRMSDDSEVTEESCGWENTVMDLPAHLFAVRGEGYLAQAEKNFIELKVPSEKSAYEFIGMKVFQSGFDMQDTVSKIPSVKKYMEELEAYDKTVTSPEDKLKLEGDAPSYLLFCWSFSNLWKTEYTTVVHFLRRQQPLILNGSSPFEKAFSRFINADDETRRDKFKTVAKVRVGNEALLGSIRMLGGERPVIIGRRLNTHFFAHPNHFEINCDVGSSTVASMLNSIIKGASETMVIDECLLVEAQNDDELPELSICACRFLYCQLQQVAIHLDAMGEII